MKTITVTAELNESEALALAQLVKRIGWIEIRANAVDDPEAYVMRCALSVLRDALANAGFAPR